MSHALIVSDDARAEIVEAIGWYEEQRPGSGARLENALDGLLGRILATPLRFAPVSASVRKPFYCPRVATRFTVRPSRRRVSATRNFMSLNGSKLMSCHRTRPSPSIK